eukprot:scaffold173262_cov18-Tisochrysis_lutea.AAC.1
MQPIPMMENEVSLKEHNQNVQEATRIEGHWRKCNFKQSACMVSVSVDIRLEMCQMHADKSPGA